MQLKSIEIASIDFPNTNSHDHVEQSSIVDERSPSDLIEPITKSHLVNCNGMLFAKKNLFFKLLHNCCTYWMLLTDYSIVWFNHKSIIFLSLHPHAFNYIYWTCRPTHFVWTHKHIFSRFISISVPSPKSLNDSSHQRKQYTNAMWCKPSPPFAPTVCQAAR